MIRIGYKASAEQFAPRALLDFGVLAEEMGFQSCFVSDHFQPWRHTDGHAPFAFSWMAALGERTSHMQLGTSVVTPTFRYHPSVVAHAVATLAVLYPDRLLLGVGTGESLNEVPSTGIAWPGFKEREGRLREAVQLMRRLWTEERVTHHGTYYQTENATLYDRPSPPVPIYLGAAGPKAAFTAGELGDGFICTSGKAPALYADTLVPNVQAGRQQSDAGRGVRHDDGDQALLRHRQAAALENTRPWAALALSPEEKTGVEDPIADGAPGRRPAPGALRQPLDRGTDADEVVERIRPYVDLGFRHLVFHAPGPDQARFLRLFADAVAPRLRAAF